MTATKIKGNGFSPWLGIWRAWTESRTGINTWYQTIGPKRCDNPSGAIASLLIRRGKPPKTQLPPLGTERNIEDSRYPGCTYRNLDAPTTHPSSPPTHPHRTKLPSLTGSHILDLIPDLVITTGQWVACTENLDYNMFTTYSNSQIMKQQRLFTRELAPFS